MRQHGQHGVGDHPLGRLDPAFEPLAQMIERFDSRRRDGAARGER
jgi:hypothetical protein